MQYTGLKDKNGKEIYEGDIVAAVAEPDYEDSSVVSDIMFSSGTAFTVRSRDNTGSYESGLSLSWGGWDNIEVIGNIYENKELLNG